MSLLLLLAGLSRAEDVSVTSNLTGAAIYLNGKDTGEVTPATLTGIAPGPIVISVQEGCAVGAANVKVVAGQTAKVSLFAIEQGGTLQVRPTPSDARVSIDGKPLKTAGQKVELECGEHVVSAEREGYAPETVTIEVTADDALVLPIELTKADLASLELSVQPRTATLLLDGKEVGTDTVTLPSVKPGEHTIGAEYTGYQTVEAEVTIAPGDDVAWHFELVRTATKAKSTATQLRGAKPVADVADADTEDADTEEEDGSDVPYYLKDDAAAEKAKKEAEAKAKKEAEAKAKKEAEEAARREADREDEEEEEDDDGGDVPYYLKGDKDSEEKERTSKSKEPEDRYEGLDEEEDEGQKSAKADKPAKERADDDERGGGGKTGLRVAGGVTVGLGAVGGVASVLLYNQADVAHDAWVVKNDAAKDSGDAELKQKANAYYDNVFVPRATTFYVAGGATVALLGTGVILFIVDAPVTPVIVPGGGMLTWHASF